MLLGAAIVETGEWASVVLVSEAGQLRPGNVLFTIKANPSAEWEIKIVPIGRTRSAIAPGSGYISASEHRPE